MGNSINTNSLFHYTQSLGNLKSIVSKGLRVCYCEEGYEETKLGIPMACFCDIPISRASDHQERYKSKYAVALSKKFIENHKHRSLFNPVIYDFSNGIIRSLKYLRKKEEDLMQKMDSLQKDMTEIDPKSAEGSFFSNVTSVVGTADVAMAKSILENFFETSSLSNISIYLHAFTKAYIWKDKKANKDVVNYYDREWRFIIPDGAIGIKWLRDENDSNWTELTSPLS